MNPCPKCQRKPVSVASPRCNFCGAALKDGDLDWVAMQAKAQADHIESNKSLARLRPLLSKSQRTAAVRLLYTGPAGAEIPMLREIAASFANEYAESLAENACRCHCGNLATRLVQMEWTFDIEFGTEYNAGHAAFLLVGIIAWSKKMMTSEFSTYHVACPTCAASAFVSKSTFERAIEHVPAPFRRKRATVYDHRAKIIAQPASAIGPVDPVEKALYYLIVGEQEKGPFSFFQLSQLIESKSVSYSSAVRLEGASELVTIESILGK